ncbi:hypothetical protein AABB24_038442 [Solanum stoloniferum]|uniref:Uncharacterized protein n=1 Tax=Solanum stoloniferum TaxID=62892 RepID=A0ABD2QXM6_9SOLN
MCTVKKSHGRFTVREYPQKMIDYSYRYFIKQWHLETTRPRKICCRSSPLIMGLKKKMHHVHKFGHWIMESPLLVGWMRTAQIMFCVPSRFKIVVFMTLPQPQPADQQLFFGFCKLEMNLS